MFQPHPYTLFDRFIGLIERPKATDRLLLRITFAAVIVTGLAWLYQLNHSALTNVPTRGGTLIEGIIGVPRFVNPALAITRADQDAAALLYSGLLRLDTDGKLVPDLAESITVSEDGLTYTINMRRNRQFHDGTPITARDAVFTIELLRDPDLKGPWRGNWADVVIEEINEYQFTVTISAPYAPFRENFTFGVMPRHVWGALPIEQLPFSQYNTEPIGSGPFMIARVSRDTSGLINSYTLRPSPFHPVTANLAAIELKFFQNEEQLTTAFNAREINSTIFLPTDTIPTLNQSNHQVISQPLPRLFAIFINQNRTPALRDKAARQALSAAINRDEVIEKVLGGYGVPTTIPVILEDPAVQSESQEIEIIVATDILESNGWQRNDIGQWEKRLGQATEILAVTLRTGNSVLFTELAELIAQKWRALGVEVQIEQYEQTGLVQSVIRSRDFQALLFGLDMNRTQDLYPFWHSSQRDDPGLNISQYTNVAVDQMLEKARGLEDDTERWETLRQVSDTIAEEVPAIFLFAPSVVYVVDRTVNPTSMPGLSRASDRFMNIEYWHARTESVWPIFQSNRPEPIE